MGVRVAEAPVDILLVEDNPDDVDLTLHAFRRATPRSRIAVVRDGIEALDYLLGDSSKPGEPMRPLPRLVLLDLKLPRISGKEVLRRMKADPRARRVPVVVLTSSREDPDIEDCYQVGANSFVVKPVDFDHFLAMTRAISHYWLELNESTSA